MSLAEPILQMNGARKCRRLPFCRGRTLFTCLSISLMLNVTAPGQQLIYESGGEILYEEAAYDVKHYELDLKIDPDQRSIHGTVTMSAEIVHPTDMLILDLDPGLQIVTIREVSGPANTDLEYHRDETRRVRIFFSRTLQAGESVRVATTYGGRPRISRDPPWEGGFVWDRTPAGEPWIGVTVQTSGSWLWWPGKSHPSDKPDSVTLRFTLPEGLSAISNGRLQEVTDAGPGWKTWHWFNSTPISNYNITLNAAPYIQLEGRHESVTGTGYETAFWVLPEFRTRGEELLEEFSRQIRFLEELLGPYPFRGDKIGLVHAPYLGMEHQSVIAYGGTFLNDNLYGAGAGFDDLLQHELSHEWWGNMVSVADWKDFWIHEGFGTYMQALYAEHLGGESAYRRMMAVFRKRIYSKREILPRTTRTSNEIYAHGNDLYFKGAWFLHTLRYVMGDELFFLSLRRFAYPEPAMESVTGGGHVRFVSTRDYRMLVNELAGEDLGWLFDIYLHQPELPRLAVRREAGELHLEWKLPASAPPDSRFPMPVEVSVNGEKRVLYPEEGTVLSVPDDAKIGIDPDNRILMAPVGRE